MGTKNYNTLDRPITVLQQSSSPSAPSTGKQIIYAKSDGKLYTQTPTSGEAVVGGGLEIVSVTGSTVPATLGAGKHYIVDMTGESADKSAAMPTAEDGLNIRITVLADTVYKFTVNAGSGDKIYYDGTQYDSLDFPPATKEGQSLWAEFAANGDTNWVVEDATNPLSGTFSGSLEITGDLSVDSITESTTGNGVVINEAGADVDFRVESDTNTHALFVRGSDGNIGIGTGNPASPYSLHIYRTGVDSVMATQGLQTPSGGTGKSGIQLDVNGKGGFAIQNNTTSGSRNLYIIDNDGYGANEQIRLAIDNNGNVGIGTSSPKTLMSVVDNTVNAIPTLGAASGKHSILHNNQYGLITGITADGDVWLQSQRVDTTALAYHILLQPVGGYVGIGTDDPITKLHVVSPSGVSTLKLYGQTSTATDYIMPIYSNVGGTEVLKWRVEADGDTISATGSYTSDERVKKNLEPIHYGLAEILQLKPKSFNWIYDSDEETKSFCLSTAQEVEAIMPEMVRDDGQEMEIDGEKTSVKAIYDKEIMAVMVKAIQEQQEQIEQLKLEIAALKGE